MNKKTIKDLRLVRAPWLKALRSFNWQLIPKRLQELALKGIHYDDRVIVKS